MGRWDGRKGIDSIVVSIFEDILVELTNAASEDPNNLLDSETRCLVLNFPGSTHCSFYSTTLFSSVLLR